MTPRRVFGLQGWLVGALLAVGMAASLAVLLIVLPTLESSVCERPRQARGGATSSRALDRIGADSGLRDAGLRGRRCRRSRARIREDTGAEVLRPRTDAARASSPSRSSVFQPRSPGGC